MISGVMISLTTEDVFVEHFLYNFLLLNMEAKKPRNPQFDL